MVTSSEHIAARGDTDLYARLVAMAEMNGIPNASAWVQQNMGTIISTPIMVNGESTSLTAVHAYAAAVRKEYLADERALPAGLNPGAVTDAHMAAAIMVMITPPTPPAETA